MKIKSSKWMNRVMFLTVPEAGRPPQGGSRKSTIKMPASFEKSCVSTQTVWPLRMLCPFCWLFLIIRVCGQWLWVFTFFNTTNILKYTHTCSLYKPLPFFSTGSSVPLHIAWGPGLKLCSWYGGVLVSICEGQGFLGQAGVDPGVPSSRRRSYTGVEQSVLCWLLDFSFCAARLRSTRLIDET